MTREESKFSNNEEELKADRCSSITVGSST